MDGCFAHHPFFSLSPRDMIVIAVVFSATHDQIKQTEKNAKNRQGYHKNCNSSHTQLSKSKDFNRQGGH
jgi:hypothetical protein